MCIINLNFEFLKFVKSTFWVLNYCMQLKSLLIEFNRTVTYMSIAEYIYQVQEWFKYFLTTQHMQI